MLSVSPSVSLLHRELESFLIIHYHRYFHEYHCTLIAWASVAELHGTFRICQQGVCSCDMSVISSSCMLPFHCCLLEAILLGDPRPALHMSVCLLACLPVAISVCLQRAQTPRLLCLNMHD